MRRAPAGYDEAVRHGHASVTVVSAWKGGRMIAADVPIAEGMLSVSGGSSVPEQLTITVPEYDPATSTSWLPQTTEAPLGRNGQRLKVTRGVRRATGDYFVDLGWYRIDDWRADDGQITVNASGLLALLDTNFLAPTSPWGTFRQATLALIGGRLPVTFSSNLYDRAVPGSVAFNNTQLAGLLELLAAWPAEARVNEQGVLEVGPPDGEAIPMPGRFTWTDGRDGTVISAPRSDTRDGVYNAYAVTGAQSDDPSQPPVYAYAIKGDGPTGWWSDFGQSVGRFASPLLTTAAQCKAAGETLLAKSQRAARPRTVVHAPDARVELGDIVDLDVDGRTETGVVTAYDLPLTAAGGPATTKVAVTP